MKITVIGATGMVGQRLVAEAASRGHQVVAVSRSGQQVEGASSALSLDINDTAALVEAIDAADAAVITVPGPRDGRSDQIIAPHRALITNPPAKRVLVVGGAGSLFASEGVRLKDSPDFPANYLPEATAFTTVLQDYEASEGIDWTMISPAPVLAPGERTGSYVEGTDSPVGESVSAEDLSVAIVDELERGNHRNQRFTVAN